MTPKLPLLRLCKLCAISVCLLSFASVARDPFQVVGGALSKGKVSSKYDASSSFHNPAAASYFMAGESGLRYNFIGPLGAGYEVGEIDSLVDELDELLDILEDDDLSAQAALDAKDRFDPFLADAAVNGLLKVGGSSSIPFFPMFYHSNSMGTFTAEMTISGLIRSTVLDDQIDIVALNDSFKINTSAALYIKSAVKANLALGYSRPIYKREDAMLYAGLKLNVSQYKLGKNVVSLAGLEDGEDIGDAIEDDYEANQNSATNFSIDAGLLWVSEQYSVGLSLQDINEPEYEFGFINNNCAELMGLSLDNCFVAQEAVAQGRIKADEVHVANALATIEGSTWIGVPLFGKGGKFGLHASIDLNDKNDALGDVYQWASVSTSAKLNSWFIPELRLGYSQNLSGTELSYYSFGVTFFKHADLDIRWSDETVRIDDSSGPRSAYFSFAIQTKF